MIDNSHPHFEHSKVASFSLSSRHLEVAVKRHIATGTTTSIDLISRDGATGRQFVLSIPAALVAEVAAAMREAAK